jgi:multiple sugar transport system permease protein
VRKSRHLWFYIFNIGLTILFLSPFYWALISSLKPYSEILTYPPTFFPIHISIESYKDLFAAGEGDFVFFAKNSLIVSSLTILVVCLISIPAGYAFSKLKFPGINILFLAVLSIIMVPFQVLLIPLYTLIHQMKLLDTHLALILIYSTFFMPFGVFIMRNSFDSIPNSIRESAIIDGASELKVLIKVFLPLTLPGVVTTIIYVFMESWNNFIIALIFTSSKSSITLQVGLMNIATAKWEIIKWGMINAGSVITMLPILILFIILQKYFIKGMLAGAIKE